MLVIGVDILLGFVYDSYFHWGLRRVYSFLFLAQWSFDLLILVFPKRKKEKKV